MRPRRRGAAAAAARWLLAAARRAGQRTPTRIAVGRYHLRKANQLAGEDQCQSAIHEYTLAYEKLQDPVVLFNRAECYRRIGQADEGDRRLPRVPRGGARRAEPRRHRGEDRRARAAARRRRAAPRPRPRHRRAGAARRPRAAAAADRRARAGGGRRRPPPLDAVAPLPSRRAPAARAAGRCRSQPAPRRRRRRSERGRAHRATPGSGSRSAPSSSGARRAPTSRSARPATDAAAHRARQLQVLMRVRSVIAPFVPVAAVAASTVLVGLSPRRFDPARRGGGRPAARAGVVAGDRRAGAGGANGPSRSRPRTARRSRCPPA